MILSSLLNACLSQKASDLHLSQNSPPMLRVDGHLRPIDTLSLNDTKMQAIVEEFTTKEQRAHFAMQKEIDFALSHPSGRFRVNLYTHHRGIAAALRPIPTTIPSLQALDAPEILRTIIRAPHGLVLVTGPTCSGKSTTLAAMLDDINQHEALHILTLEDPIEFIHTPMRSLIHQRELKAHTLDFVTALSSALRENPNIILVGELRDLATIRLALTAAETGHLVLATLHTGSAVQAIDRLVHCFSAVEQPLIRAQLAETLVAVIAQRLYPQNNGGLVAAHEIMRTTPAIRHLIREHKTTQIYSCIQTGSSLGMQTLAQSVDKLVQAGKLGSHYLSTETF